MSQKTGNRKRQEEDSINQFIGKVDTIAAKQDMQRLGNQVMKRILIIASKCCQNYLKHLHTNTVYSRKYSNKPHIKDASKN